MEPVDAALLALGATFAFGPFVALALEALIRFFTGPGGR